jgi:hypothetical protein
MNDWQAHLRKLKNRYRLRRVGEAALLSLGGGLVVGALAEAWQGQSANAWQSALAAGLILFVARYRQLGLHVLSEQHVARYLNRCFESLEDSAELLMARPEELTPLHRLQQQRLFQNFELTAREIRWPQQWAVSMAVLALGLTVSGVARFTGSQPAGEKMSSLIPGTDSLPAAAVKAELSAFEIDVNPPAYTGLRALQVDDLNVKAPEGSRIDWRLQFSGAPAEVMMIFSNGDSAVLSNTGNDFSWSRQLNRSGYYSINWRDRGESRSSDFFKLEAVKDEPPAIEIEDQEQFAVFPWQEKIEIAVNAVLSDDYGLTEAYAVATVSKGSGESVKFREERLRFARPSAFSGRRVKARLELNTKALGMEPGDELYYYVEAWDNRRPQRQSNRTETYFLQLQDTSTQAISFEGGLGVDLMPEYFRSQRQIIIDSEKLLAEKAGLERAVFNERSNDLAHDQKVLRLRYGQFLGEEFESGIGRVEEPETTATPQNEEELLEQYGHAHDNDNEHNLVEEHDHEHDHDHAHEHVEGLEAGEQEESPLEAFIHAHDSEEEATFFIQSVKMKLRAALSMMWDAELHLRLNDPARSLPYQYKILRLLKEISNDSRIYVHRTGFDAPPLKEEKRLTGDLAEIRSSVQRYSTSVPTSYPAIRRALPLVEQLLRGGLVDLQTTQREILLAAGNELAGAAIEQPEIYLARLGALRALLNGEAGAKELREIRDAFWRLLPLSPRAATGRPNAAHGLQDVFIQELKAQSKR